GHTQHDFLPIIQITDLGGVYAVTFLVAAVNGLLFEALCQSGRFRALARVPVAVPRLPRLPLQIAAVAALFVASLGYGFWQLGRTTATDGPTVAILQCSVDQATRNARGASVGANKTMFERMQDLTRDTWTFHPKPDLIIWPETTYPLDWIE